MTAQSLTTYRPLGKLQRRPAWELFPCWTGSQGLGGCKALYQSRPPTPPFNFQLGVWWDF